MCDCLNVFPRVICQSPTTSYNLASPQAGDQAISDARLILFRHTMSTDPRKADPSAYRFAQLSTHSSLPSDLRHEEASRAVQVDKRLNQETRQLLLETLFAHPVLTHLRSDDKHALIDALKFYEIGPNEFLYEAGSLSRHLYFLDSGTVVLLAKASKRLLALPGLLFGDQALRGVTRFESASTLDATTFWMLSAEVLQSTLTRLQLQVLGQAKAALLANGLDYYLSPAELNHMAAELLPYKYLHGEKVVVRGEPGEQLFFLAKGSASVLKEEGLVHVLTAGECFGEQALLYGCLRTANVEALEDLQCFAIEKAALTRCLGSCYDQVLYRNCIAIALRECASLQDLTEKARQRLLASMRIQKPSQVVIPAGAPRGEKLWVLLRGSVKTQGGEVWTYPSVLGAEDLLCDKPLNCFESQLLCQTEDVLTAEIGRKEFFECIGRSSTSLDPRLVTIFADLSPEDKTRIKSEAELKLFSTDEVLVTESTASTRLFVIKSGSVRITRGGKYLRTLSRYETVGERHLLLASESWVTAVAERETECWSFDAPCLSAVISQLTRFALLQEAQSEAVKFADLTCVEALDNGQFGCVCYALSPKPCEYAVKCVSRRRIEGGKLQHDLLNERDVLLRVNHPMCVKLHSTSQDQDNLYFVLEYVEGALLHDVLYGLGQCTDMMAKFYMGCLVLIFEHLQERSIVYRDLKPENLMVDSKGFLKLIDFGSAKVVTGRTRTVIGTPQFMAPEIVLGKAYSAAADMWSLGVLLYDMLCGGVPWGEGQEDVFLVFQQVISAPLTFPDFIPANSPARSLITQLLSRDPAARASLNHVKHHEFMAGVTYESLCPGLCSPPYLPKPVNRSQAVRAARLHPKTWSQELAKANLDEEPDLPVSRPGVFSEDWDQDF